MRKLLAIFLALTLAFGCMAFGSSSAWADDSVNLTFWYWVDNPDYSTLMQNIVADFNATNGKGITVTAEEQVWDGGGYSNNLLTACIGGGGPDVATFKLTSIPSFVENGLVVDLTDYINAWEDKDEIDANLYSVMQSAVSDGGIYLMPWMTQFLYVYYRPSYFAAAGVEVPTTYDEFLNCIEKCTMEIDGKQVYGFGMRGSKGGQEPWGSFICGAGGSWDDLTSEGSVKGMQDFIDIYTKGFVPPTALNDAYSEIISGFQSGLTAMTVHHISSSKAMVEIFGDDVSAFPFPGGANRWTSMGETEIGLLSSCKNPDAAFEFIKYMTAYDGQKVWCESTGNLPVAKSVQAGEFFQSDRFVKTSFDSQGFAGVVPITTFTSEWIANWPATISQALTGQISAADCMAILQQTLYEG